MTAARRRCAPARSACARAARAPRCRRSGSRSASPSMVAVLGISESSKADLLAQLDQLGTNLLRVAPGQSFLGDEAVLPESAAPMLRRVARRASRSPRRRPCRGATVRRSPVHRRGRDRRHQRRRRRPVAARDGRRDAARAAASSTPPPARYPAVVLGADAATHARHRRRRLARLARRPLVHRRSASSTRSTLAAGLDTAALIGFDVARVGCSAPTRNPSTVYVRADPDRVERVRDLLGRDGEPGAPGGGRRLAPVRRARGARGGQDRVHLAVPRPRRRRAAGRRRRDRQRDGDLGARAPLGDRPAARARRHAPPRRRAVPVPSRCCWPARGGAAGTLLGALVTARLRDLARAGPPRVPAVALAGGVARRGRRGRRRRPLPGAARRPPLADGGAAHDLILKTCEPTSSSARLNTTRLEVVPSDPTALSRSAGVPA